MKLKRISICVFSLTTLWLVTIRSYAATPIEQQVSDAFIRSAVTFMDYTQAVDTDEPYDLASILLDAAVELTPDNAEAWALRAELAKASGDQEGYERALAGYLETGVDDETASYDLIRARLTKQDTLDGQLGELEQLLDSESGRSLSGPLRSRLASFAASLGAELLDEKARRRWAIEAARADPANPEAADMMLRLVTELTKDPVKHGTATVNLIRADPLNPAPRISLAGMLAEQGAYERAAQQYEVAATRLSQQPLALDDYVTWSHCLAITGQDELALKLVNQFEAALNQPTESEDAEDEPLERVEPPLRMELIRLTLMQGEAQKPEAQKVFDTIRQRLASSADNEPSQEQAETNWAENLSLVAAVYAPDLDQASQLIQELKPRLGEAAWVGKVADGWLALRRGDPVAAEGLFRGVKGDQPLATCGLALVLGRDDTGRARLLQEAAKGKPATSFVALVAGRELVKLNQKLAPSSTGLAVLNHMTKYPESFWHVDLERTPWLEVRLKVDPARLSQFDPVIGEITVWNTTRFPLAIGQAGAIRSQGVVLVNASVSGQRLPTSTVVLDLGRKFTLAAGERMVFNARLDYHRFGSFRYINPNAPFVFSARLVVNPTPTPRGSWLPSGIGGVAEVRNCLIQAKPARAEEIDAWIQTVAGSNAQNRMAAMANLAGLSVVDQPEVVSAEVLGRTRSVLLGVWENGSDAQRAWLLINARDLVKEITSYPGLLEQAKQSGSKLVWLALLSAHATEADSAVFGEAVARQDLPEVSRFGERLRRLLRKVEEREAQRIEAESGTEEGDGLLAP